MDTFKQKILNDFNHRSSYENEFHRRAAHRLIELAHLKPGQRVLDIATGTGLAAIAAAQIVGPTGRVLGTDFALGMLQQAQKKITALRLTNIEFQYADVDEQKLQDSQFDVILCSSAIVYLTDIPNVLRRWHHALKPGGMLAFSCLQETSPSASILFRTVVQRYGVTIPNPNELMGTPERCRKVLEHAGFTAIDITTEQFGFYMQDMAEQSTAGQSTAGAWRGNAQSAFGLQDVTWSQEKRDHCKQEYFAEISNASTPAGYWNDVTMFFVRAHKPGKL